MIVLNAKKLNQEIKEIEKKIEANDRRLLILKGQIKEAKILRQEIMMVDKAIEPNKNRLLVLKGELKSLERLMLNYRIEEESNEKKEITGSDMDFANPDEEIEIGEEEKISYPNNFNRPKYPDLSTKPQKGE